MTVGRRDGRTVRYAVNGAFRELATLEWGERGRPVVVCVHGLTRNAQDFAALAEVLAVRHHVVAVDLPGRGGSEWLPDPALYTLPTYVVALTHLLATLPGPVGWVGTSLGGLCGMAIAAMHGTPIGRLVLNDIGPFIPRAALVRIRDYVAAAPAAFRDVAALEMYLRRVHAPFGQLSDAEWEALGRQSARPLPSGEVALHYDPAIAEPIVGGPTEDVELWSLWEPIRLPRLVLRGATSDILLPETFARMEASGARTLTVPDCGHAPALGDALTTGAIAAFLTA